MPLAHAILLGIVQGLTEFIPVSSTAHLAIVQWLLGMRDADVALSFDLVLHLGTALALIVATWKTLVGIVEEAFLWAAGRPPKDATDRALIVPIVVGTVPGVIAGLFLLKRMAAFRTPLSIGITMLVAAAFFVAAERIGASRGASQRGLARLSLGDAIWIGVAQAAAGLFPGLSRSGTTISTGRLRGLRREDATRFSFLLALPIILGAGAKALLDLRKEHAASDGAVALGAAPLVAGFLASAVVGYLAVEFLLRYLKTHTLKPFAIYLAILGAALVAATRFVTLS